MAKATQFCIALLNKPGTLARLCRILGRANVNIAAISVAENNECSWVRLVASPAKTVRATLSKGHFTYTTLPVLRLGLKNRPSELARVASRLAKNGININYVYGSSAGSGDAERSMLIVGSDDIAATAKALGR
ncbi:MAG: ACT domain-containing protein [Phycisphaerales bacterium]|nr:ACT domain-containing protein [Phycisphaerales bacterium]